MIQTILIDHTEDIKEHLLLNLHQYCPFLSLKKIAPSCADFHLALADSNTEIVFINPSAVSSLECEEIRKSCTKKALICVSNTADYAPIATYWQSVGYLLNPIQPTELIRAVDSAQHFINSKKEQLQKDAIFQNLLGLRKEGRLIGIPTIEGFEIISVDDIIRCEGLQKCTRVITTQKSDIVSSYNIGVFKKLLSQFGGFFCPHRSHIINMLFIRQYKKIGTIKMKNGSIVPIARNKKEDFLQFITLLSN